MNNDELRVLSSAFVVLGESQGGVVQVIEIMYLVGVDLKEETGANGLKFGLPVAYLNIAFFADKNDQNHYLGTISPGRSFGSCMPITSVYRCAHVPSVYTDVGGVITATIGAECVSNNKVYTRHGRREEIPLKTYRVILPDTCEYGRIVKALRV